MRLALGLILFTACRSQDSAAPDIPGGFIPELPTATCGALDYTWRSTADVGALVAYERVEAITLGGASIGGCNPDGGAYN